MNHNEEVPDFLGGLGDCMEDLNLYLKDVLAERPHTRIPSADTVLRGGFLCPKIL